MHFKIGTRSSKLALWQANYVAERLAIDGNTVEIIKIDTKGDQILDVTLSKIGSKGLFTEELEQKLISEEIDLAVHSAKDMPSSLPDSLEIISFSRREECHDILLSFKKGISLKDNLIVGTSSTRRVALLKKFYPHIQVVDMRGNLQTRIKKLEDGVCDALILAYAGVHRMGFNHLIVDNLSTEIFTPPVGQGSVAVEIATKLREEKKNYIYEALNHFTTSQCLLAERAYLNKMNGGCSIPTFAIAEMKSGFVKITGGIVSLDGTQYIKKSFKQKSGQSAKEVGFQLADWVLSNGGKEILETIKGNLS